MAGGFSFAEPWLLALAALPLLFRLLQREDGGATTGGALFVPATILGRITEGAAAGAARDGVARWAAPTAIWLLLISALAGPQLLSDRQARPVSGREIMLALDLSGSMERKDFAIEGQNVARLDAVKDTAAAFVRGRAGDRIGLAIFADHAYIAAPPTHDLEAVAEAIDRAAIGVAGRSTGIAGGLGLALKRLARPNAAAGAQAVILLSDGINNAGAAAPLDVAALAKELGVRVHAIALGPKALEDGGDTREAVDAKTLRGIAETSGGGFFRVKTIEDLRAVNTAIDRLEGPATDAPAARLHRQLWPYPAGAALALLCFAGLRLRRA